MNQFKIVIPSFNSIDYLPKTLSSVEAQTDHNYQVCVIDDASTLPEQRDIILKFCQQNGWMWIFNEENHGALYGIIKAVEKMKCHDDDVIVNLDGDDWLSGPDVLAKLRKIYDEEDVLLTWGQCEIVPPSKTPVKFAHPAPSHAIQNKLFRRIPHIFFALRTFKYLLWRHIHDEDLRDQDGAYFRIMWDKAIMWPMVEMAGSKIRFIPDTLYYYNVGNPLNDYANTTQEENERVDQLIRSKPPYDTLPFLQ